MDRNDTDRNPLGRNDTDTTTHSDSAFRCYLESYDGGPATLTLDAGVVASLLPDPIALAVYAYLALYRPKAVDSREIAKAINVPEADVADSFRELFKANALRDVSEFSHDGYTPRSYSLRVGGAA